MMGKGADEGCGLGSARLRRREEEEEEAEAEEEDMVFFWLAGDWNSSSDPMRIIELRSHRGGSTP